jgi:hypothetical protein
LVKYTVSERRTSDNALGDTYLYDARNRRVRKDLAS